MFTTVKVLKFLFLFLLIALLTDCAAAKKNPYFEKRKQGSRLNTSQLGRNKYYFSSGYQKKLNKNYRKK